ncbi:MAG: DUF4224 domain-containing protein [Hyphomicrobiales bacterium]|nr:MAG: DUF4224 domain-containing protein [Hyphomicrobiales bacterium]
MSLTLSESEIVALTGYQYPTRQLEVLRARGFYRAVMGRSGVVLTRAHYEAVESGRDAEKVAPRKVANLSHLRPA